jgi:hypothetical protein
MVQNYALYVINHFIYANLVKRFGGVWLAIVR